MDARWKRTDQLVQAALQMPEPDRLRYIDSQCAGDERLRVDVCSLLEACQGSSQFLETPALTGAPPTPALTGRIGRYRLLERIAAGGMGEVYLAEQTEPVHRRVAIKIVKRGMDTDDILRRFAQERQTLAELNHSHIAKLLDGGATDDGRPYLVMEYVEGRPITEYCRLRKPSLRERLNLFRGVCDAVEHAHRKLVVHRDLKPSNILIAEENGVSTPKLLDFGIAKMLEPGGAGALTLTEASQRPLTPEYASPEQIRGQSIGTSSDVYSLGLVLYELLTGRRPYEFESRAPAAIERAICESSVPRPSEVVRSDPLFSRSRRALAGDLDRIVLTALRKEPERRYGSVERLSEDIRRWLTGLPISARPDTALYRGRKFLCRHWVGATAAAACFVVLSAALVVSLTYWRQAVTERNNALEMTAEAKRQAKRSERTTEFYQKLLHAASPEVARGRDTAILRELLDLAAQRVTRELADEPSIAAGVRNSIGATYAGLGLLPQAVAQFQTALEHGEPEFGADHPDALLIRNNLATVLSRMGRLSEAEPLHRATLAAQERQLGPDHPETLHSVNALAVNLKAQGRAAEAEPLSRRVLSSQERKNPRSEETLAAIAELALCLVELERFSEAQALLEQQLSLQSDVGSDHPTRLRAMHSLSLVFLRTGKPERAAELSEQVLEQRARIYGPEHVETLAAMNNLGKARLLLGELQSAADLLGRCLSIVARDLPEHEYTAVIRSNYGLCLGRLKRFDEAEQHLLPAHEALATQFGPADTRTRRAADALVELYDAWNKPDKADHFRQAPATNPARDGP
jgi:tetratricopeptide (TPR) repeat protein